MDMEVEKQTDENKIFFVMHNQDEILPPKVLKQMTKWIMNLRGGEYHFTIQSPPHFLPIPYDWVKDLYIKMIHNLQNEE